MKKLLLLIAYIYICTPCKAQLPVADFSTADTTLCPYNGCISFTNHSQNATSYQWVFNGANPDSSTDTDPQSICYEVPGVYDVTLIAFDSSGSDTLTLYNYITVYPAPANPNLTTHGDSLLATQGYAAYQWYFASDTIGGATNYYYVPTINGNYNLVVTDTNGCQVGAGFITIILTPAALFASSDTTFCAGTCIDFTNLSQQADSFEWIFEGAIPDTSYLQNPSNICYYDSGSYDVTLIAIRGNLSDTLTLNNFITVYPNPPIPAITQNGDTLFAPQGYAGYQWYNQSNIIPGATNYYYVMTTSANYNLIVTGSNGCQVGAGIIIIIGINEHSSFNNQITISPNPASNAFTISSSAFAIKEISIFNMLGESVYNEHLNTKYKTLNTKLRAGVYFVRIGTQSFVSVKKLIVE